MLVHITNMDALNSKDFYGEDMIVANRELFDVSPTLLRNPISYSFQKSRTVWLIPKYLVYFIFLNRFCLFYLLTSTGEVQKGARAENATFDVSETAM